MSIKDLPKEFRLSYHYSEFLYSNLVTTYNKCLSDNMFETKILFKVPKDARKFSNVNNEAVLDWLLMNDYSSEHFLIIYKSIVSSLLLDFITYISESISNILKGNLSVTYTLLRKPLKENLTILEEIYIDPKAFYQKFINDDPNAYDPNRKRISTEKKLEIIESAIKKGKMSDFYTAEVIHSLRFDNSNNYSFDNIWNKAMHLITNRKEYKTERMNLNFIFSRENEKYGQLDHLFYTLPILLNYTNDLIEELLNLIPEFKNNEDFVIRRKFGFILWSDKTHLSKEIKDKVKSILKNSCNNYNCPSCDEKILINNKFLYNYCFKYEIKCSKCKKIFYLSDLKNKSMTAFFSNL